MGVGVSMDSGAVGDEAPYAVSVISTAAMDQELPAQSPLYGPPQPPYDGDALLGQAFAQRLQPPLGFSGGSYALNTQWDAGSPVDPPDSALPGLRDGAYPFSQRLKSQGDQGIMDALLRQGGSYLDVCQPAYVSDEEPVGR